MCLRVRRCTDRQLPSGQRTTCKFPASRIPWRCEPVCDKRRTDGKFRQLFERRSLCAKPLVRTVAPRLSSARIADRPVSPLEHLDASAIPAAVIFFVGTLLMLTTEGERNGLLVGIRCSP